MAILDFNDYSRTVWFHQVSNFWKKNIYSFSHKGLCQNFVLQWRPSLISAWHKNFFLRGSYKEQFYHVTTLFSMWFLWINIFDFWIDHKSIIGLASILNFQIKRKSQKVLETIFRNISTMISEEKKLRCEKLTDTDVNDDDTWKVMMLGPDELQIVSMKFR